MNNRLNIQGLQVTHISFSEAVRQVLDLGLQRKSSYACFANVHMVIEAHNDPSFREIVNSANLVLADGKPIAAACNLLYKQKQERVSGMDFMPAIIKAASRSNASIFLYGSSEKVLELLQQKMAALYPSLKIAGAISPPFRPLTAAETAGYINEINKSEANIVLVALGCPKQERWMYENHQKINAVLLGLGGAFPVMAGIQQRSPQWMQRWSLEWLYRLLQEPKRMYKRYFYTNLYFLFLFFKKFFAQKTK